jgi:hypothetical protein
MLERSASPDSNRLSVLTSAVLLSLALTSLIDIEQTPQQLQVFGIYLPFGFNLRILTTLLAAGLTATGMDWFLRSHPLLENKPTIKHWILPTLTTLVVSVPLYILPVGRLWWLALGLGGALLVSVFLAEYASIDPSDSLFPAATAGLTSLSFAMFLILAVILSYASARLIILLLLLFPAALLVSLRSLYLYLHGQWEYAWPIGIAFICTQLAAGLHYWPLTPIQFGLLLLGPLYALTSLAKNIKEDIPLRRAFLEPGIILIIIWGLALIVR